MRASSYGGCAGGVLGRQDPRPSVQRYDACGDQAAGGPPGGQVGLAAQQKQTARAGLTATALTAYRLPFALGMPVTRGSRATAAHRARATALNWASTM